jgi:hypothetical protein
MLGYGNRLPPLLLSETVTKTETSCAPEINVMRSTTVFLTTAGESLHVLTYTTTSVSISRAGPSCPYGGTYYPVKCTRLCGCQYDVCITFDYNCANDYPAVYATRTALQVVKATTTSIQYLVRTGIDFVNFTTTSTTCKEALVEETIVREVSNPNISKLGILTTVLIIAGVLGLSGGVWARSRSVRKRKITFRTIYSI